MPIPSAPLGKNGPEVNRMGLGLMGLSAFYGTKKSDEERLAFLDKALELGQTFWDTADYYADSEDLLHKFFTTRPHARSKIFLATKFGANKPLPDGTRGVDSSPAYCHEALTLSLTRLGLPFVDLYYCHRLDGITPIEKTVEAMVQLKNAGKIKYLGLSECSAASLRRAHAVHPITAVQVEYSAFSLDIETNEVLATARELGVAVVAYSPLGRGMLSGEVRSHDAIPEGDFRKMAPRFSRENFPKNLELVEKFEDFAKRKHATASQISLAWLLVLGRDVFPIPGTTRHERLRENLGALEVSLSEEEVREIRDAVDNADVRGFRGPEAYANSLFMDTPALEG